MLRIPVYVLEQKRGAHSLRSELPPSLGRIGDPVISQVYRETTVSINTNKKIIATLSILLSIVCTSFVLQEGLEFNWREVAINPVGLIPLVLVVTMISTLPIALFLYGLTLITGSSRIKRCLILYGYLFIIVLSIFAAGIIITFIIFAYEFSGSLLDLSTSFMPWLLGTVLAICIFMMLIRHLKTLA